MGDKIEAKKTARGSAFPCAGSTGGVGPDDDAMAIGQAIVFRLLVKAASAAAGAA